MSRLKTYVFPILISIIISTLILSFYKYPMYKAQFQIYIYASDSSGQYKTTNDIEEYKLFNKDVTEFAKSYNKNSSFKSTIYPIQYDCFNYNVVIEGKDRNALESQIQIVSNSLTDIFKKHNKYLYSSIQDKIIYNDNNYSRNIYIFNIIFCYIIATIFIIVINNYFNMRGKKLIALAIAIGILDAFTFRIYILLLATIIMFLKHLRKKCNVEEFSFIVNIFIIAFIIRILAIIIMYFINFNIYNHYMSFFQPDELFYNHTANILSDQWRNLIFVNPIKIVKIDQYGYNLFQGVINFINGESYFASKIINSYISSILVAAVYFFCKNLFGNKKVGIYSSIMIALMPTFILFSTFGLRDIIISFLIFCIIFSIYYIKKVSDTKIIISLIIFTIILFYLRRYAVVVVFISALIYLVLKLLKKYKINIIILSILLVVIAYLSIIAMKIFYAINVVVFITDYFKTNNTFKFISGLGLSLVNLDFIVANGGTNYGKLYFLRFFYPDTFILLISFGVMILGVVKLCKIDYTKVIPIIVMIINFIIIYKVYYGGWFLRTQLQIMHFQIIFIAAGCSEIKWISNLFDKIYKIILKIKY